MDTKSKQLDTKDKLIELSKNYIQTLGFNGFSFQTLADDLGIRKASVHHHFSSKEELGLALIAKYSDDFENWLLSIEQWSPTEKIRSYFHVLNRFAKDECKICPNGVFASDYNTLPKSMKKKLIEFHLLQREWLQRTLEQGVDLREFKRDLDCKWMTDLLMAATQGSLQLSRIRESSSDFKKFTENLFALLK